MSKKDNKIKYMAPMGMIIIILSLAIYFLWQENMRYKEVIKNKDIEISRTQDKDDFQEELNKSIEERDHLLAISEELTKKIEELQNKANIEREYGLVKLSDIDPTFVEDLRYATENNFTKKQIYPDNSIAILRTDTAMKLKEANEIFQKDGYTIKIFDAYRPHSAQYILWDYASEKNFVADPKKGSKHNMGVAVDITLVDKEGNEIEMGTEYDNFTEKAAYNYSGHTETALKNMKYLRDVMEQVGFKGISNEWWHFDDIDWKQYEVLDIGFDKFV